MKTDKHPLLWCIVLAAFVSIFCLAAGQFEFGSHDLSALIDTSWRLHSGELPFRDFPCLLPPSFYLLGWAAFSLFGIKWWAFSAINVLCYLVLIALGWNAVRTMKQQAHPFRLLQYQALALSVPILVTSHLWHSTLSEMLVVTLLLLTVVLWSKTQDGELIPLGLRASLILVMGVLVWAKPNIAFPAILGFLVLPLVVPSFRKLLPFHLVAVVSAGIWSSAFLLMLSISPLQTLKGYTLVSDRPKPRFLLETVPLGFFKRGLYLGLEEAVMAYLVVAILIAGIIWLFRERTSIPRWILLIALASAFISFIGFCTDWDTRSDDLAPSVFGMLLLLPYLRNFRTQQFVGYTILTLAATSLTLQGATRERMNTVGPWAGPQFGSLVLHDDSFFGEFDARERFWQIVTATDQAVHEHRGAKTFFGMRLEFEYARLGMKPVPGLPTMWYAGSSYPIAAEPQISKNWENASFDLLVIASKTDLGYDHIAPKILADIPLKYKLVSAPSSPVDVYVKR